MVLFSLWQRLEVTLIDALTSTETRAVVTLIARDICVFYVSNVSTECFELLAFS